MSSKDIGELLSLGAKHYAGKDYESAVEYYSELNELQETLNGESNPDYLFLYGKALFQLAVSKAEFFGSGKGVGVDEGEEEEEEEEEEAGEEAKKRSKLIQQDEESELEEDEENERESQEEIEASVKNDDDDAKDNAKAESDEPDDFENAWEILEIARSLYQDKLADNEADRELKIKLSETYDLLGEVSLEAENFQQAYQDFEACLSLRKELYEKEDRTNRSIIESYYKLSLALEFDPNETVKCKENLQKCMELLKERINETDVDDEEQKDLLKELELKMKELNDANDQINELKKSLSSLTQAAVSSIGSQESKVNDLTSMVIKKKRTRDSSDSLVPKKKSKD